MKAGAPTLYKEAYNEQARKLCLLGYTDKELAYFFNVCEDTIHEWKKVYPDFSESINKGKDVADGEVAQALYHRALGYSHAEDDIKAINGEIVITKTTKHYPPDTAAAFIWLKNRRSKKWKDKQIVEHEGNITLSNALDEARKRAGIDT
jgi:hypothetical protein